MENDFLPPHLRKYVVEQNYEKYTPLDQAVWRYILRQLKDFLSRNAHECYVEGLSRTGIDVERIPKISDISKKLEEFGWRALPVSGFIPPAAFMELQALGVLPIASDMRTLDHLLYTPAPDIVHEAAGHAPILIHPEFAEYLRQYAQVARKAIISKEDLDLYEAIRELSDIKENPSSTTTDIEAAEKKLDQVSKGISHISEAAELSRMNWWTAEYGLIGSLENPKIFGAGLLSSIGESKWCLSAKVKKIPLGVDCIKVGYDITEPQPQLFVTPDFKHLSVVLEQMAKEMAFRRGGLYGLNKAIQAQSVNTAELSSGLQISGVISDAKISAAGEVCYLQVQGPTQLCYKDHQLEGHSKTYHSHGFGTPVGFLKSYPTKCPSALSASEWAFIDVEPGKLATLEFVSGVVVTGKVQSRLVKEGKTLVLSLVDAKATFNEHILFDPAWGTFDMALGSSVASVFGGPADRQSYGDTDDFVAKRVPQPTYTEQEIKLHKLYLKVRSLRETAVANTVLEQEIAALTKTVSSDYPNDWLIKLEALELLLARAPQSDMVAHLKADLEKIATRQPQSSAVIQDGLRLAGFL